MHRPLRGLAGRLFLCARTTHTRLVIWDLSFVSRFLRHGFGVIGIIPQPHRSTANAYYQWLSTTARGMGLAVGLSNNIGVVGRNVFTAESCQGSSQLGAVS